MTPEEITRANRDLSVSMDKRGRWPARWLEAEPLGGSAQTKWRVREMHRVYCTRMAKRVMVPGMKPLGTVASRPSELRCKTGRERREAERLGEQPRRCREQSGLHPEDEDLVL
jgi:hypothetical protein